MNNTERMPKTKDILELISNFLHFFFPGIDSFCVPHNYIHKLQF